ncbi:MAG: transporter [Moraxellaceae bacterium]|mgnify:CR=1 FL=1|jgi:hypothetical protein|nr:transporter [Moraxellaceae bacterium]MBP8853203.1 transporter [Moraxellaceae bacterium]MBP9046034.1 transporter [Moraxellaceae bacterium]MBP9731647.1 transporter [Moraxellaceae bacterium]
MIKRGMAYSALLSMMAVLAQPALAADDEESTAANSGDAARQALTQKADDATSEKNLEEVFQASENQYSLLKKGKVALNYGVDYSFYRDSRIDIAVDGSSSQITRFRIEEDAQHSVVNSLDLTYGVWNNLTVSASLPLVAKFDTQSNLSTTGLGDISLGVRWQPVPLKRGLPSTTLFASLSTATGDSPYEINRATDLSTGKGYYSLSGGGSISKVADPVVLFASASYSMSSKISDLNQPQGSRIMTSVEPGDSVGFSMGLAYSLNYDVSITSSFQQSYGFSTKYGYNSGNPYSTPDQVSASMNFSLGLRTNPKRIVNLSMGFGLTEDASDVSLGFSMPIDFVVSDN